MSGATRSSNAESSKTVDIASKAFSAGKWAYVTEGVGRLAQPIVFLIFARLLVPEDLGLVTAATIGVSFAQVFWDSGFAKALIQREMTPSQLAVSTTTVFWFNAAVGLLLYGALLAGAGGIATLFGDPRLRSLIWVQGLTIPIAALGSVPAAWLQRDLRYRPLFWARFGSSLAPGIVGLPVALLGGGYWALAAGALAGTVAQTGILFLLSGWKPVRTFSVTVLRKLGRFALWSIGEGQLAWIVAWLDAVVIGLWFDSHALGLYRTSDMAVRMAFALAAGALMPVLFAAFSRLQSDRAALDGAFVNSVKGIALMTMPLAAVAAAAPAELSALLLGEQWREAGEIVRFLAIMHGISWLAAPNAELYRAAGRPDWNLKVMAGCLVFYVPALLWSVRYGLEAFLWVRLLVATAALAVHVTVAWKVANFPPRRFGRAVQWFVAGGVVAAASGALVREWLPAHDLIRLAGTALVCLGVYAVVCRTEQPFILKLLANFRRTDRS